MVEAEWNVGRHSIAYSNWNGQEQIQETRVPRREKCTERKKTQSFCFLFVRRCWELWCVICFFFKSKGFFHLLPKKLIDWHVYICTYIHESGNFVTLWMESGMEGCAVDFSLFPFLFSASELFLSGDVCGWWVRDYVQQRPMTSVALKKPVGSPWDWFIYQHLADNYGKLVYLPTFTITINQM